MERFVYPFSAIVGQDKMKLALILNAIHPAIGGVLIRGEKGTGKSTAVRALARLLPELAVVADCPYRYDPDAPEALCSDCQDRVAGGEALPRGCWRRRTATFCMSTRSTCSTTIWSTSCSMPRPWGSTWSSARGFRSGTRRVSSWWAP